MNNRGWGLRSELWICAGMILFFAIAVFLINNLYKKLDEEDVLPKDYEMVEDVHSNTSKEDVNEKENNTSNLENSKVNNKNKESNNSNYNNLEDKLVSSAVKYANKYLINTEFNDKIVTVVRLKVEDLLDNLKVDDIECSGYVRIIKESELKYYPYIKCGSKYQSSGYEDELDNTDL